MIKRVEVDLQVKNLDGLKSEDEYNRDNNRENCVLHSAIFVNSVMTFPSRKFAQ